MKKGSEKEEQQLKNRLRELADKSFRQNLFTFTGFLGLSEQDIFWKMETELSFAAPKLWGGYEGADRVMVRFGNPEELGYEEAYEISYIHISPLQEKFSDDFSHRDFLGALMNLGLERSTLGDIRVGHREAYLYCLSTVAGFICDNLDQVRHTHVKCRLVEEVGEIPQEEPVRMEIQVASERIDGVLAKVYNQSRSEVISFFQAGKVFVDGRLCENNSRMLKGGEVINLRGFGKFVYRGMQRETRKGKLSVSVEVYK